ncbi:hypothetical protein FSZ31_09940 [Sphingorhabdus soli]|uniref:Lipoprotein n=1 Tax=Flavisphingopyxis soli TaxID=2601267 RepID=A0A5C6UB25_9SPHN|nr:hypothetical protein [Sphingorhabdus soli]TXC69226.1 hypothetical protein FSZ31_09940 [Sphingorhabdus soli]
MTYRIPLAALAMTLILPIAGCVTTQQVARDDGYARLGEPTRAGPLIVRPTRIVEDSRCPINARCVWAGRLIVRANITHGAKSEARNLTLGTPVAIAGGRLMLDSGEPGKLAGQKTKPADYRLHFSFTN